MEYREIVLTQGQVTKVSPERFDELSRLNWHAQWNEHTQSFYAVRQAWISGKQRLLGMHRQIFGLGPGDRRQQVDHRNGNTLDNRDGNLRLATARQNAWNRKVPANSASGVKGVAWYKPAQKWVAYIYHNGTRMHLGYFPRIEDAIQIRVLAAQAARGEFAREADLSSPNQ